MKSKEKDSPTVRQQKGQQHHQQQQGQQQLQKSKRKSGTRSIWNRLYDPSSYTGVYAERFRSGTGRINAHASDGNVRDLSEIVRPGFRTSTFIHTGKGWEPGQHANSGMLCDTPSTRRMPESPRSAFNSSMISTMIKRSPCSQKCSGSSLSRGSSSIFSN
jgi:hypothetical protein